ncbi:hypothetical protein ACFW0C_08240 [Aerococcus sp. NPDC058936]|uniref:hypothetical protein n=1 Tax=Aerococcus sp. NPDC058936 TaxID=3346674 RepID=UPI00366B10B4
MKTPKVVMGFLAAGVLAAGYTIAQVQADENAQDLYTSNVAASQVESVTTSSESTSQSEQASASTEEVATSEVASDTSETVTTSESTDNTATDTEATSSPIAETTSSEEVTDQTAIETPDAEPAVAEETAVETADQAATEVAPAASEEATSVPDQTENRQIIIDRVGLASDALDGYSDEQIAQSRVEAENLGSDPGYSYSWLLQQTPANAATQSM